ncbi:cinnamyl alcohol dehydrogenase [Salix suchowensis]|nr:cinnamyl alcohol dehydrogenase [Salix suchowensis]
MLLVRCSQPNSPWEIIEVPLRAPKDNEVLIRVHASGVCNSEHFVKEGTWPGLQYPRTPGHEVIGRVAAVGSRILAHTGKPADLNLEPWLVQVGTVATAIAAMCVGREITGLVQMGTLPALLSMEGTPNTLVVGIEEEALQKASYAELAPLFCAGATVFDAIRTTNWSPGDICVVQGVGGLGHLAVQVYAVSSGPSKKDLAISLGAHEHIDSSSTDVVKYIQSLGGAQIIVCTAPYAKLISDIIPAVAKNGTVTLVSAATDKPIEVRFGKAEMAGKLTIVLCPDVKTLVQEYTLDQFTDAYDATMANKARFRNVIVFR